MHDSPIHDEADRRADIAGHGVVGGQPGDQLSGALAPHPG